MENIKEILNKLEDAVFEEENYSKAKTLINEIIKSYDSVENVNDINIFLSASADAIDNIEESTLFNDVTSWVINLYKTAKNRHHQDQLELAESITTWLNHKLELLNEPENSEEARLALELYSDLIAHNNASREANALTNDLQGYATYSLMIGITDSNYSLIDNAISSQRKIVVLYKAGEFPDYYNMPVFITGAKSALASTLMEAYDFDNVKYSRYLNEIGNTLKEVNNELKSHGTDFDREYNAELLKKYKHYTR